MAGKKKGLNRTAEKGSAEGRRKGQDYKENGRGRRSTSRSGKRGESNENRRKKECPERSGELFSKKKDC